VFHRQVQLVELAFEQSIRQEGLTKW
jgi:hypothetical protein